MFKFIKNFINAIKLYNLGRRYNILPVSRRWTCYSAKTAKNKLYDTCEPLTVGSGVYHFSRVSCFAEDKEKFFSCKVECYTENGDGSITKHEDHLPGECTQLRYFNSSFTFTI
jgi:hypothetical protein